MEGDCLVREERLRMALSVMVTFPTYSDNLHLNDIQFK